MEDCFQLLHFHLGQPNPQHSHRQGRADEAARVYVELVKAGAGLKYMDVGGGLGVDYDGSQTNFESSVKLHVGGVRQRRRVPLADGLRRGQGAASHHPCRKAAGPIVAHHSLLVFNVLGISGFGDESAPKAPTPEMEQPLLEPDGNLRRPDV